MNKKIIVPLYGAPEDEQAIKIYKKALPGYKVIGIDCRAYLSGAIHCQTQNVPDCSKAERGESAHRISNNISYWKERKERLVS